MLWLTVSQLVYMEPKTRFLVMGLLWGFLSDEMTFLSSHRRLSHSCVRFLRDLSPYFTVSDSRLFNLESQALRSFFIASCALQIYGKCIRTSLHAVLIILNCSLRTISARVENLPCQRDLPTMLAYPLLQEGVHWAFVYQQTSLVSLLLWLSAACHGNM
jgi:hypothetical protein